MPYRRLTREAVLSAIAEYDEVGRDAFLARYGFRPAKGYFLVHDGRRYDSKAIAGVANKFLPGETEALRSSQFSGGVADAAGRLSVIGFEIDGPSATQGEEDPDWTWDEHVLALDLYLNGTKPLPGKTIRSVPGKTSRQVIELSQLLNALGERAGVRRSEKYRNANGVYMKLMNLRRFDPEVIALGRVGLPRGAKGEGAVWKAFGSDMAALSAAAKAIRLAIADTSVLLTPTEDYEASEGGAVLRLHLSRERDRKLVAKKKQQAIAANGRLVCEVCSFDFAARYGELGDGFIEAHHRKPVSQLTEGEKTRLDDLALVCANCHRMLHRYNRVISIDELASLYST